MANEPIRREFDEYGTKGGSLPGVLTSATFAKPKARPGDAEGDARVMALFFENMPLAVWLNIMKTYRQQDFERRLVSDPEFFEAVRDRLGE